MSNGTTVRTAKPLLDVLAGARPQRTPCWFMRQAGRYLPEYREVRAEAGSFLDLVYTPDLAAEVTLQPIRRYGMDAAILFSDILVIPHALGQDVRFVQGEGPQLEAIGSAADLKGLAPERVMDAASPVFETVRRLARALPEDVALIGFAGAPWTVATYMAAGRGGDDQKAAKSWAFGDPEGFGALLAILEEATARYLMGQVEAGAEVLQIFDSWAGNLPEPLFESAVIAPTKRLVARLKETAPDIPIIGFPRLAGANLPRYVAETGVDAVSLDSGVPLAWADGALPDGFPVQGNLDPQLVVAGGPAMRAEASRILQAFAGRPHIFNLGHGFTPDTPPDHVADLTALIHDFSGGRAVR